MLEPKKSDAKNDIKYLEDWLVVNGWELQHHLSDTNASFYSKVSKGERFAVSLQHQGGAQLFDTLDHLDDFGCGVIGYIEQEVKQVEGILEL